MAEFCGFEAPSPLGCLLCKVLKNVKLAHAVDLETKAQLLSAQSKKAEADKMLRTITQNFPNGTPQV